MTRSDRKEAVNLLSRVLEGLLIAAGASEAGRPGADLRRAVGDLEADAVDTVQTGNYPARLAACFTLARESGATFAALERLRQAVAEFVSQGVPARRIRTLAMGYCLAQQARALADTTFRSREDVERVTRTVHAAFTVSIDHAADALDQAVYRALVALHAAVTRDLSTRAQPLPRLVTYRLPQAIPALTLSTQFYGDGGRAQELIDENRAVHPLFMPNVGRALSA